MINTNFNQLSLEDKIRFAQSLSETARHQLSSGVGGHLWMWIQARLGQMPSWAEKLIQATQSIEKTCIEYSREGKEIPKEAFRQLGECRAVVSSLASKVNQLKFEQLFQNNRPSVEGSSGLLTSSGPSASISSSFFEWQLNLGLMVNAYRRAKTSELKKEISFLILNYLAKIAPVSFERLEGVLNNEQAIDQLKEMFQLGYFIDHSYHRESSSFYDRFKEFVSEAFATGAKRGSFHILDTSEIDALFPLKFQPISLTPSSGSEQISSHLLAHFVHFSDQAWNTSLSKALLFDLTPLLSQTILAEGNEDKERSFNAHLGETKELINKIIQSSIEQMKLAKPELFKEANGEEKMRKLIIQNMIAVCRADIKSIAVLKTVPLYEESQLSITPFLNLTGIRMGGVSARKNVFDFTDIEALIATTHLHLTDYSVPGSQDTLYFHHVDQILDSHLFTRFTSKMKALNSDSHLAILGQSTLQLIKGLLEELKQEKWNAIHQASTDLDELARHEHLTKRSLVQTTLYRMMQHLAKAENNLHDFKQFADAVELVHYEMATLLQLTTPFESDQFQQIYPSCLTSIPEELKGNLTVGVARSAMNAIAGICSLVLKNNPLAEIAYGQDSYFEEIELVGKNRSVSEVLNNSQIPSVDLYIGEFNHNINVHKDYHHYLPGDVMGDVEKLLKEKPSQHLTVALDSTIDLVNSPHVQAFLARFSREIQEGRLNVIFFRSGQKFEMLGMDNYYGAPFYMINNGAHHWDSFKGLTTQPAFQTDPLSLQWFSLVNKYAPEQLDHYRGKIFKNSREILNHIPSSLRLSDSALRVSSVDHGMDPAFIDIKIIDESKIDRYEVENIFYEKMIAHKRKVHSRGSFGFYHPNFNFIDNVTLRVNPGLDPTDNVVILEAIKEIASKLKNAL